MQMRQQCHSLISFPLASSDQLFHLQATDAQNPPDAVILPTYALYIVKTANPGHAVAMIHVKEVGINARKALTLISTSSSTDPLPSIALSASVV